MTQTVISYPNEDTEEVEHYALQIHGRTFTRIDGNQKDEELSALLLERPESIELCVQTNSGLIQFTPDEALQTRLRLLINEGLDGRIPMRFSTKTWSVPKPGCLEMARFLKYGYTASPHKIYEKQPWNRSESLTENQMVYLFDADEKFVHAYIHLKEGLCVSKFGQGNAYFHNIDQAKEYYEKATGKALSEWLPVPVVFMRPKASS